MTSFSYVIIVTKWEDVMTILDREKRKLMILQISLIELAGALLLGIIIANVTKASYSDNAQFIDTMVFLDMKRGDKIQHLLLFLQYRIKEYLLIWVFSITVLAVPYNTFCILYKGFVSGFVIGALSVLHGWKGSLYGISLGMPHDIVFIIVLLQTVCISYKLHNASTNSVYTKRSKLFVQYLPAFLVLLSLTIIGCFIEAFLSPAVADWMKTALKLG